MICHEVNKTAGGARNAGIDVAKGDYLWFVDPDDAIVEKKVYMPSEQAGVVMSENDEVKNLVKDLGLDIKYWFRYTDIA